MTSLETSDTCVPFSTSTVQSQKAAEKLLRQNIYRGICRGGFAFGLLGFLSGVAVCVAYRLPVPPLAVTECGALLGALLGALWGTLASNQIGRKVLHGLYLGFGAAVVLALLAPWSLKLPASFAAICLGAYLGYQNGVLPKKANPAWKMHR
jgi:hypothetical protein